MFSIRLDFGSAACELRFIDFMGSCLLPTKKGKKIRREGILLADERRHYGKSRSSGLSSPVFQRFYNFPGTSFFTFLYHGHLPVLFWVYVFYFLFFLFFSHFIHCEHFVKFKTFSKFISIFCFHHIL